MSIPVHSMRMSNYGLKIRSPEEVKLQHREMVEVRLLANTREQRIHKQHLSTKGDGTKNWPGVKPLPVECFSPSGMSFFNNNKLVRDALFSKSVYEEAEIVRKSASTYDRMFHVQQDYNSKLHRDDRQHTVGLNVHAEETVKAVPVLSSSAYGHRHDRHLEMPGRQHVRIERVLKGFYRTRGNDLLEHAGDKL
ncbi:PREDICTED: uncharacterized protein LOC106815060 [Priapulus caudatus]|uniref:Uncharacterized protein LOC106815060 n=1 Tax=Priapulus caudatus TaxID=37621 RepID=A0ABM1ES05_PRICU|nr:PREDICTED: uncharacterized protein LOC106815060 [Priapulus caudatus]